MVAFRSGGGTSNNCNIKGGSFVFIITANSYNNSVLTFELSYV